MGGFEEGVSGGEEDGGLCRGDEGGYVDEEGVDGEDFGGVVVGPAVFEGRRGRFEEGHGGGEVGREKGECAVVVGEEESGDES